MVYQKTLIIQLLIILCFQTATQRYERVNTTEDNGNRRETVGKASLAQQRGRHKHNQKWVKNSDKGKFINIKQNGDAKRIRRRDDWLQKNETLRLSCHIPELSCRNCCEYEKSNRCIHRARICRCDSYCTFYKDCCVDYEVYCRNKTNISVNISQQKISCIKMDYVTLYSTEYAAIWVVSGCPKNRKLDEITRNCEKVKNLELNITSLRNFVPVIGKNDLIYRNEFCAKCNGVERFEFFEHTIKCSLVPPDSIISSTELVEFALKYCRITISQRINHTLRTCYRDSANIQCLFKLFSCQSSHDVDVSYNKCLSLLGLDENDESITNPGPKGVAGTTQLSTNNFAIVFDVSRNVPTFYVKGTDCSKNAGEFYDFYLEICRSGEIIPPVKDNLDVYVIVMWLEIGEDDIQASLSLEEIMSQLSKKFNFKLSQVNKVKDIRINDYLTNVVQFELKLTKAQSLSLLVTNFINKTESALRLTTEANNLKVLPLRRLLFFSGKFQITCNDTFIAVIKTTSRQLACIGKQTYAQGFYSSLENGKYYLINSSGKVFRRKDIFLEENGSISFCENVVSSTCLGRRIKLIPGEYLKFDNFSIFNKRTKTMHDLGEYDSKDGEIFMCILENPGYRVSMPPRDDLFVRTYLTFICLVLSLVCLFLVVLSYLIFTELRNLPGKNLLNLSISLFLAQSLWLMPDTWFASIFCHVMAVMRHYLFLVSFVAMATIAWNTYSGFATEAFLITRYESRKNDNKKFYTYSTIVWGFPAIFVSPCVVVDNMDIYSFYVHARLCWFANVQAQKYVLVLPVGIFLLFNAIFFTLTVIRIRGVQSETRLLRISDQRNRSNFWVYLKLSALMGFCWIFGFIDILVEPYTPVFSYLFVIFACLQGVYIALSFVIKKRIWEMYKNLFQRKKKSRFNFSNKVLESLNNSNETRL